jgi:hypothetical protein
MSTNRRSPRHRLFLRHGGLCHWCDRRTNFDGSPKAGLHATVDHVYPRGDVRRSHAPGDRLRIYTVLACRTCNAKRGNLSYDEFLLLMRPEWRGVLTQPATVEA